MEEETKKLAKASFFVEQSTSPYGSAVEPAPKYVVRDGMASPYGITASNDETRYREDINQCRYFYKYDPIASTVVNRMGDMSITQLRLRRNKCTDEEFAVYGSIVKKLGPLLDACAADYLITGMAVPDYVLGKTMGSKLDVSLGRTRYTVPDSFWVRDPTKIILKRRPTSLQRSVFIEITDEESFFIKNQGKYPDGTYDEEAYENFVREFPDYVRLVKQGKRKLPLPNCRPILRKVQSDSDYPMPFLVAALSALHHKLRIKQMDYSIATRAVEAILHVKVGSDEYPASDDSEDIANLEKKFQSRKITSEPLFRLITNHVTEIAWIYPDLEALLSEEKYQEPNSDILMAMGFPRKLLVGEALRSNAGQDSQSTLGPISTLNEMRRKLLEWVELLLMRISEENGFKHVPTITFAPIAVADMSSLSSIAVNAMKEKAISRDTLAGMFGTTYESEREQMEDEETQIADMKKRIYPDNDPVTGNPNPLPPVVAPTKPAVKPAAK